ncbi:MAG: RDD family protein [Nanobdellota archaeon]
MPKKTSSKKEKTRKDEKKNKLVLKKANLLKRLGAFALDIFIAKLTVLIFFDLWANRLLSGLQSYEEKQVYISQNIEFFTIFFTFYFLILILYFSAFEYILGKTPGKAFFKISVISIDGTHQYWKYLVRSLELFVIAPIWVIDILPLIFRKERLLEMITKTTVINSRIQSVKKK